MKTSRNIGRFFRKRIVKNETRNPPPKRHMDACQDFESVDHSFEEKDRSADARTKIVSKWNQSDTVYMAKDGFKRYWETLEEVWQYQVMMISGGRCYLEHTFSFFPENKKLSGLSGLIIGCNYGENTSMTALARSGVFKKLTVLDIAEDLLLRQEALNDKLGFDTEISFECLDLNKQSLPKNDGYDFIHAWGTIHHIAGLERLFSEINDSLIDDGIFAMREYVGPSHLQFTDQTVDIVNKILSVIPEDFRLDENHRVKEQSWRPTRDEIIADDPSEAVRSDQILPIAEKFLKILSCQMTGGTLLNPLLHGIAGNFEKSDHSRSLLKMIILLEKAFIEAGLIPSDYVYLIARKKP